MAKRKVFSINGEKRLRKKFSKMDRGLRKALNKDLNAVGALISADAKASIRRLGGKFIQYGDHWSSLPGLPPNEETGDLRKGIRLVRAKLSNPEMQVVSRMYYSAWLEYGTRHIDPRPFMGPAYRKHSPEATKRMKLTIGEFVKRKEQ